MDPGVPGGLIAGHAHLDAAPALLLNPQPGGETDRFRLFDAAVRTLADLARTDPVLVVLDDLHRADEASLALLRFLVLTLREVPVLVLGTYRDTDVDAPHPLVGLVADLAADATFDLIGLDRLSRADTLAFLRQRAPLTDASRADTLYRRTGGNPFFLTEVVKLGVTDDSAVPASVEAAIEARVSRLPEATRTLLGLAAVLGRDADADLLAETAGLARRDVLAGLTPAVKQGLIGPNPQNPAEYRFVHVLVQQTLYAGLPPDQQLELHDQLATGLAHRVDAEPGLADAAAHHAARAVGVPGGRDRAFAAAFRAAGLAAERLADETAAQWYTRALELAPPDPTLEVTLLLELGRVAGRSGQSDVARSAYDRAWVAAVRADDRASGRRRRTRPRTAGGVVRDHRCRRRREAGGEPAPASARRRHPAGTADRASRHRAVLGSAHPRPPAGRAGRHRRTRPRATAPPSPPPWPHSSSCCVGPTDLPNASASARS